MSCLTEDQKHHSSDHESLFFFNESEAEKQKACNYKAISNQGLQITKSAVLIYYDRIYTANYQDMQISAVQNYYKLLKSNYFLIINHMGSDTTC